MKIIVMAIIATIVSGCMPKSSKQDSAGASAPVEMTKSITLLHPEKTGATLLEALENRASSREFDSVPLNSGQLGGVLWAASGINRPDGKQTAPSALALYPVKVYAFFKEGTYLYDPASHSLSMVLPGDNRNLCGMQDFVFSAPLNLLYIADLSVFAPRNIPYEKGRELAGLDAAGYAQNVNLYCAAEGMASITRGSYPEQQVLSALGLDDGNHAVVLAQTVGRKK